MPIAPCLLELDKNIVIHYWILVTIAIHWCNQIFAILCLIVQEQGIIWVPLRSVFVSYYESEWLKKKLLKYFSYLVSDLSFLTAKDPEFMPLFFTHKTCIPSRHQFLNMRLNWGQYSSIRARGVPVKNGFQCSHLLPNFGLLFRLII